MAKMGTVWDRTAEFLGDNLPTVLPVALLAFFVPASISGSFQSVRQSADPGLALTLSLLQLAFGVLSIWGSLAITAMALEMSGQSPGTIGRNRLIPGLVVTLVLFVAMLLLFLPVAIALQVNGYDMMAIARGENVPLTTGMAAGIALYMLVLVALFVWFGARLALVNPVIVRERRMLSAIRQSWKLTRGSTWKIIGVILLFAMVSWVSYHAARIVFGSIFELIAGSQSEGLSLAGVLTSIVAAAVQTGFTVLVPVFTAKLYLALTAEAGLREGVITA